MKIKPRKPDEEKAVLDAARAILRSRRAAREAARAIALRHRAAEAAKAERAGKPRVPDWQLLTGDCVDLLKQQPARSARLIFADPPYNIGIDYGDGRKRDLLGEQQYCEWCERWIEQARRVLADDGALFLMTSARWLSEMELILGPRFHRRNTIVWVETFGTYQDANFAGCWRPILYWTRHRSRRVFNADAVRVPSLRQTKYGDDRANPAGRVPGNVWTEFPRLVGTSVERMPGFPTQLPRALVERIVAVASNPGDLVIDPCNGSGTTGEAALRLGRRYVGMDVSAAYIQAARLRLQGVAGELLGIGGKK